MTRGKKLGILSLLLLGAMGAAVAALMIFQEGAETQEDTAVTIFTLDPDQVTALSWTYDGETMRLEKDGQTQWTCPEDGAFPLDQSYPDAMVGALREIQAERTIENVEDLAEYGLADPVCAITVETEEEHQLAIGNETGLGGQRYLSIGDGNVYLVEAGLLDSFALGLYDLVETETIPDMSDVSGFQITAGDETLRIEYLADSGLAYSDQYTWFWKQGEEYTALDTEETEALLQQVTGLGWESCVDYRANQETLGSYGLLQPSATVTVSYTETAQVATNETDEDGSPIYETQETDKTFTLELGDYDGASCYARLTGSTMVYRVDGALCDALLAATGESLLPQDVIRMDWSKVTGMEIQLDGQTYTLEKTVQEETDEEGNTTETYVYQQNGKTVEITDTLDQLQDMEPIDTVAGARGKQRELALTFYQDSERYPEVELVFYQYDSGSCLVGLNGETRLLVDRDSLLEIIETMRELLTE